MPCRRRNSVHYALQERESDPMEALYDLRRRERLSNALAQTGSLLNTGAQEASPQVQRWQNFRSEAPVRGGGEVIQRDLRMVTDPLSVASVGEVTGFRNTPKPGPEMKPVIPPWNYEKMATAYEEKKLVAKHDILAAAQKGVSVDALRNRRNLDQVPKTPEVQIMKDLKEKIGELDKKLRKIEGHDNQRRHVPRSSGTKVRSAHAGSAVKRSAQPAGATSVRESYPRSAALPKAKDAGHFNFAMSNFHEQQPREEDEFSKEMHAQVRALNTRMRELLGNSAIRCAKELKSLFRELLDEELESIRNCSNMRQDTKARLARSVRAMVMRRVDLEIEKRRLFEWPEEGVRKYATGVIRAEEGKRRMEERVSKMKAEREAKVQKAASIMPSVMQASRRMLRRSDASDDDTSGSQQMLRGQKARNMRSLRGRVHMMGLDVQPREARKPLEVALDGPAGAALRAAPGGDAEDEETRKAAEVTAQVTSMLSGVRAIDRELLKQVTTLQLAGELMGRPYCIALQNVLKVCPQLRSLDLQRNDLSGSNFHGIMDALSCADPLPLEVLDLSSNFLGADGGASVAPLVAFLGRPAGGVRGAGLGCQLQVLRLRSCMLSDKMLKGLAAVLPDVGDLQELDLSENQISDSGAKVLSQAFMKGANKRLRRLNLARNDIRPAGVHFIAAFLEKDRSLRSLNLSWNQQMGQAGLEMLVLGMKANHHLGELHLEACELTDAAVEVVALLAGLNTTLQAVYLGKNNFTADGKRRLLRSLETHAARSNKGNAAALRSGDAALTLAELQHRVAANSEVYIKRGGRASSGTGSRRGGGLAHMPSLLQRVQEEAEAVASRKSFPLL